jgi:hypothetical protein
MTLLWVDEIKPSVFRRFNHQNIAKLFFVFVTIFSKLFLALMGRNFMSFSFSTAGHNRTPSLIRYLSTN